MRTQRARSNPCVLVQSSPSASRVAALSRLNRLCHAPARAGAAPDLYGIRARITHIDRAIIRAYLQEQRSVLTAGKAREEIPGKEAGRQLLPNSTLPSSARTQSLPVALERKLSALPAGFERVAVDRDVLLMASATREIVDVMCNACARSGPERHIARERGPALTSMRTGAGHDAAASWRLFERNSIL